MRAEAARPTTENFSRALVVTGCGIGSCAPREQLLRYILDRNSKLFFVAPTQLGGGV
jgi:hypothetical protein